MKSKSISPCLIKIWQFEYPRYICPDWKYLEMEDFKPKGPEYTEKFKAGRHRTYFFDVYSTRKGEFYLTVTESKKRADGKGYERHKIFLYKEDVNRFAEMLNQSVDRVKSLMPEYDFDEFARRQAEWEEQRATERANAPAGEAENGTAHAESYKEPEMAEAEDTYTAPQAPAEETPPSRSFTDSLPTDPSSHDDLKW